MEEDDETFSVSISVASPHTVTPPATVTVTIMDDNDGTFNRHMYLHKFGRILTICCHLDVHVPHSQQGHTQGCKYMSPLSQ